MTTTTTYIRTNVWDPNHGGNGTFTNPDGTYTPLYWYARAVAKMQEKPISDPTSWWFYAAIHGEYLTDYDGRTDRHGQLQPPPPQYPNWNEILYIKKSANLQEPPIQKLRDTFWRQCQHGTWFFAPWHRGYLVALENLMRDIIVELGGPNDWALPYWNYLKPDQNRLPRAFNEPKLPDGSDNPLKVAERFGPDGDGSNVRVQVEQFPWGRVSDDCQLDTTYEGYGGPKTGFHHRQGSHGDLESDPHDIVHGMVGGHNSSAQSDEYEGLMADPGTAALDPVFYLHHANIDRMWAAWNEHGNRNPLDADWVEGPSARGDRTFAMPLDSSGKAWSYTPGDVQGTKALQYYNATIYSYTYDDLNLISGTGTEPMPVHSQHRLAILRGGPTPSFPMPRNSPELVGASTRDLELKSGSTLAQVQLDTNGWRRVAGSLANASAAVPPDEVYLVLEDVTGTNNANLLSVYVNKTLVKTVSLFGIRLASMGNHAHGGSGLTFRFNITEIVDQLHLAGGIDIPSLDVEIKTARPILRGGSIKVGRVGVYRVGR